MAETTESDDINNSTLDTTKGFSSASNMSMPINQLTYSYDREEMLALRECKYSRTRPAMLLKEFDNEDGLFSPDKWLQHKWQSEGVENRVKRKQQYTTTTSVGAMQIGSNSILKALSSIAETSTNNSANELDNQTVLSPQRRGFASGCRGTSETNDNEKRTTQQSSSKARWRQGQLNNGTDFKPYFQKSALEANNRSNRNVSNQNNTTTNSPSWTMIGPSKHWEKNRRAQERERTRSINTENESVPEWMDEGPVSVTDIIELKGFDDDPAAEKKKERKRSKGKEPANVPKTRKGSNHTDARAMTEEPARPRSARQKRHSGGDIAHMNNSRPSSRQTPHSISSILESRKNSTTSPAPVRFIQASELESSILKEQQEKMNKQKVIDSRSFDLLAALGIESPESKADKTDNTSGNGMPNSDAEFAAFILGLSTEQIAKPSPVAVTENATFNSSNALSSSATPKQNVPATSRLSRFFVKNAGTEEVESMNAEQVAKTSPVAFTENAAFNSSPTALPTTASIAAKQNVPAPSQLSRFFMENMGTEEMEKLRALALRGGCNPHFTNGQPFPVNSNNMPFPLQQFPGTFAGHFPSQHGGIPPPFPSNYFGPRAPSPYDVRMPPPTPPPGPRAPSPYDVRMPPPTPPPGPLAPSPYGVRMPPPSSLHSHTVPMNQFGLSAGTAGMPAPTYLHASYQHPGQMPFPPPLSISPLYSHSVPMNQFGLSAGTARMPGPTYLRTSYQHPGQMPFPPPLSISQQQQPLLPPPPPPSHKSSLGHHYNQNMLNSPAFMPTSVMRQISKIPGVANPLTGGSEHSGAFGSTTSSSTPPPFLQKLFADIKDGKSGVMTSPTSALRAILGRDPPEHPTPSMKPAKISGCLKLEEIEQQQLQEIKQQQQQQQIYYS